MNMDMDNNFCKYSPNSNPNQNETDSHESHNHNDKVKVKIKTQKSKLNLGRILSVGNNCLDQINIAVEFPNEDSDQRGLQYYWQRGGNSSNICTVLSQLSVPCEFLGVLADQGVEASWVKADFIKSGIETDHCVVKPVQCATATVIISQATGSRTILFYPKDRPDLTYAEFNQSFHGDFSGYSWVHFEVRTTIAEISCMIDDVIGYNTQNVSQKCTGQRSKVIVSIEIEKPELKNPGPVAAKADIVFISKDIAKIQGFCDPRSAVEGLHHLCRQGAILVCAWGDVGAAARYKDATLFAPALTGIKVIDTLGAGDTFVAGVISYLWGQGRLVAGDNTWSLEVVTSALNFGCQLAGIKCSMYGYQGLNSQLPAVV